MLLKIVDILFGLGLFVNALLFVPQALRIYRLKDSKDISLITFLGFILIQAIAVLYGYMHRDFILMYGFLLTMVSCGVVVFFTLRYRKQLN